MKKITKTALSSLVAVTMIPAVAAPLIAFAETDEPAAVETAGTVLQQIEFVTEDGQSVQTVSVELTNGKHNFSELALPAGYALVKDGSFVPVGGADVIQVLVRSASPESVTIHAYFVGPAGDILGGGYYNVQPGVENYSVFNAYIPSGYRMVEAGDFFVQAGADYTIHLKYAGAALVHVSYKSEGGKDLGSKDYFVDEDGDGIANYSELPLPEGYVLKESGDFSAKGGESYVVTLKKEVEGSIIHVNYVDENGNSLGGGDYMVDPDDDGIASYSELVLPEGYELKVGGDFFVDTENPYTVALSKVEEHQDEKGTATLIVKYVKDGTSEVVGEDAPLVAEGVLNESHLFTGTYKAPKGYELIGDAKFEVSVDYGKTTEVFVKVKPAETKVEDESKKKESESNDKGVDTAVAMPSAGAFGSMSAGLAGMIALLKRRKK